MQRTAPRHYARHGFVVGRMLGLGQLVERVIKWRAVLLSRY